MDSSYIEYLKYSLSSLLINNSNKSFDIVFFYDTEKTLESLQTLAKNYNCNFIYKAVTINDYIKSANKYNPYYRLEIFTLDKYDKILFLDCDTIICKNVEELFYTDIDFGAVKYIYNTEYFYKQYNLKNYFNAGVLLIGKKYLNKDTNLQNKI